MSKKIILLTGAKGSGKTHALLSYVKPIQSELDKLVVVDTEDSWSDELEQLTANNLHIGKYIRAYERFTDKDLLKSISKGELPWVSKEQKNALINYYNWFVVTLAETLDFGEYKYLAIDTIEPLEAGLAAWVEENKSKAGWSTKAQGRMETEGVRPLYDNLFEAFHQRGIETILLASHLKNPWLDNRPVPGKIEPSGRLKLLSRICSMMFWLTDGNNPDGAPRAIRLKARLSSTTVQDGHWVTHSVLPDAIPHFTWDDIEHYKQHPANHKEPAEGETLTQAEKEMISELLTDKQMELMVLGAQVELEQAKQQMQVVVPTPSENHNGTELHIPALLRKKAETEP